MEARRELSSCRLLRARTRRARAGFQYIRGRSFCLQTDFCGLITGNPIREHRCPPCWAPLLRSPLLR
jgi:hypothetical protein